MNFKRIVLASASPRRESLLKELGLEFEIIPADIEEWKPEENVHPKEIVIHNAHHKAQEVGSRNPDALVIGADTVVSIDGTVLNKPQDRDEATEMLLRLSGHTHTVYTGLTLYCQDADIDEDYCFTSRVTFKEFNESVVQEYFKIVNPLDKAGAYGIQEGRELIVANCIGWVSTVMGLPIEFLQKRLMPEAVQADV